MLLTSRCQAVVWLCFMRVPVLDQEASGWLHPGAPPESDPGVQLGVERFEHAHRDADRQERSGAPAREGGARIDYWDQKAAGLVLRVTGKARTSQRVVPHERRPRGASRSGQPTRSPWRMLRASALRSGPRDAAGLTPSP